MPTLIMHGDDDQIVPIGASAMLSAKLVKSSTLKVYPDFPLGMCTINKDQINADLLAFIKARRGPAVDDRNAQTLSELRECISLSASCVCSRAAMRRALMPWGSRGGG